jgi:hypothetical protein
MVTRLAPHPEPRIARRLQIRAALGTYALTDASDSTSPMEFVGAVSQCLEARASPKSSTGNAVRLSPIADRHGTNVDIHFFVLGSSYEELWHRRAPERVSHVYIIPPRVTGVTLCSKSAVPLEFAMWLCARPLCSSL